MTPKLGRSSRHGVWLVFCSYDYSEGSRSGCLAKWFFGGLDAKTQKPHMLQKSVVVWPCRRRRQGQKHTRFLQLKGFWFWHPRPQQNHLAKKPLRDPSELFSYAQTLVIQRRRRRRVLLRRTAGIPRSKGTLLDILRKSAPGPEIGLPGRISAGS